MVVDGGEGFVGADIAAARRAIEHAVASPHGEITIELDPQADGSAISAVVEIRSLPATEDDPQTCSWPRPRTACIRMSRVARIEDAPWLTRWSSAIS